MKISALAKLMNDYGTKPRIKVIKHLDGAGLVIYEGNPRNIEDEVAAMKVNSFTVLGAGYIEIHTS